MNISNHVQTVRSRVIRLLAIPAIAFGTWLVADPPRADAGGFSFSIGSPRVLGFGTSSRYGFSRYGTGFRGVTYGYGYPGYTAGFRGISPYRSYRPTTRYYHTSPSFVPRSRYYGYVPGYYGYPYGRH
ncbi:MAG: hypothetical protein AAGC97_17835 [Planctomycetota bacterium]